MWDGNNKLDSHHHLLLEPVLGSSLAAHTASPKVQVANEYL
jgi:hypothetical protein